MAALACALGIALFVYHMPANLAFAAAGYGAAFGLFPIGWIVLNAIFIYRLSVDTGQFAVLQQQVAGISGDRRIQALLIAFSFGAFVEGAAGFGAPVAITGALMIGLGFKPLEAAKLALIGNTAPVAFGSLGIPLVTLAKVTGLDLQLLSSMAGRQAPIFALIVPFWLIAAQSGWRSMVAVWPACFITGATFSITQFLVSNFHGPWLVDMAASLISMSALVLLLRFWKPHDDLARTTPIVAPVKISGGATWRAVLPWVLLTVFVFAWSLPAIKGLLNGIFAPTLTVPALHNGLMRMPPVVPKPTVEAAEYACNFLSATGTALLAAGIVAGLCLGMKPLAIFRLYGRTIYSVRVPLLTIALMLALGFTTRFSGSDTTMGLALAATGSWFPFFSPILGWLGVALTGSDTSSNVLFGNLQQVTAQQLGISPILTAASNSTGGVMGKMIDAQSIVVASVATGGQPDSPNAGTILRAVFWHSLSLALLVGLLVAAQAYWFPWMIPR